MVDQISVKKSWKLKWAKHQRRWWGKWHLYLGIFAGLIVSIVGVTGSILVFSDEIDERLNPEMLVKLQDQKKIPLHEIVPVIREKYPDLQFEYIMNEHEEPNQSYRLYNFETEEEFYINPYTGELCGKRIYESSFIHIVTDIHRTLLIPGIGRYIVGFSTLILLILTITGLRLWIPARWKQVKTAMSVKFTAGFKRQNLDWHNVIGLYSSPVVVLLSLTGVCITFSIIVVPLLFLLSGESPQGVAQVLGAKSVYTDSVKSLSVAEVAAIGMKALPDGRIAGIALPEDSVGNYRLDVAGPGLPVSGKREMLIIDQYSGKILLNSRTDFPNVGNAYLSWLTPIHYGNFGGLPTQILALIGGVVPLLLFITGFIVWWPRYKKQRRQKPKSGTRQMRHNETDAEVFLVTAPAKGRFYFDWKYFAVYFKKGLIYAGWFVFIGGIMGALYGAASGIVIEPAVFTIAFTAVLVVANLLVALIAIIFNIIFLAPFNKGSRLVGKYFAYSSAFAIVFFLCYILLINTGLKIF